MFAAFVQVNSKQIKSHAMPVVLLPACCSPPCPTKKRKIETEPEKTAACFYDSDESKQLSQSSQSSIANCGFTKGSKRSKRFKPVRILIMGNEKSPLIMPILAPSKIPKFDIDCEMPHLRLPRSIVT